MNKLTRREKCYHVCRICQLGGLVVTGTVMVCESSLRVFSSTNAGNVKTSENTLLLPRQQCVDTSCYRNYERELLFREKRLLQKNAFEGITVIVGVQWKRQLLGRIST